MDEIVRRALIKQTRLEDVSAVAALADGHTVHCLEVHEHGWSAPLPGRRELVCRETDPPTVLAIWDPPTITRT